MAKRGLNLPTHTVLDVPYRGQQFQPRRWRDDGFDSAEQAIYWSRRSCGVACVGMLLDFHNGPGPSLVSLLAQGLALEGYSPRGWIHATLARMLDSHGVPAEAMPIRSAEEFVDSVRSGIPFITSVGDEFPTDGNKGGHLVVVTGCTDVGGALSAVYFNDPSAWGRSHHTVTAERFFASFTGRVVRPVETVRPADSCALQAW
ncbi:MAG: C39 family peptidase [Pseudonocardia sp.]